MNWPIVIKNGANLNQTLSGIQFDKFGNSISQNIFICDEWLDGFNWAKENNHTCVLFVNSGTIVLDWHRLQQLIEYYPHTGLIAHLIWHPGDQMYINDQCWFMDIRYFEPTDFTATRVSYPSAVRSNQNLHDDYTPLWVKPIPGTGVEYDVTNFGQGLVARQLNNNRAVVNWNNSARDLKLFLYDNVLDLSLFQEYKDVAENQLWVFNNESISIVGKEKLVSPGSGLYWMLNIVDPATTKIQIVDISRVQVKFCQALWHTWDGIDYGGFVWQFINENKLIHYELDNPRLSPLEKLKLKGKTRFIEYVNTTFNNIVSNDFSHQWCLARATKTVDFCNDNLITWVLNNDVSDYDHIWTSNILKYKWTLLHTTVDEYKNFQSKIK